MAAERNWSFDDLQRVIGNRADIMTPQEIRELVPKEIPPFKHEGDL